jgi:hypothetical protein
VGFLQDDKRKKKVSSANPLRTSRLSPSQQLRLIRRWLQNLSFLNFFSKKYLQFATMGTARKKALHRDEYKKQRQEAQIAGKEVELPRKKFYRQRAHANPFSDYALK